MVDFLGAQLFVNISDLNPGLRTIFRCQARFESLKIEYGLSKPKHSKFHPDDTVPTQNRYAMEVFIRPLSLNNRIQVGGKCCFCH